jgi:hypothetical protein
MLDNKKRLEIPVLAVKAPPRLHCRFSSGQPMREVIAAWLLLLTAVTLAVIASILAGRL